MQDNHVVSRPHALVSMCINPLYRIMQVLGIIRSSEIRLSINPLYRIMQGVRKDAGYSAKVIVYQSLI